MLHGRRPHQNRVESAPRVSQGRQSIRLINRRLQWKYAWTLGLTSLFLVAAFAGPALYFVRDNYEIFTRLAYGADPRIVSSLERELGWITALLGLATVASGVLTGITTLRITTLLLGPLSSMEKHMRKLIRGDWSQHEFKVREADEIRDLTGTYAYLYRTLRAQAETELKGLEKIIVDPAQAESFRSWQTLVNLKRRQLGLSEIGTSEETSSFRDSRRAS